MRKGKEWENTLAKQKKTARVHRSETNRKKGGKKERTKRIGGKHTPQSRKKQPECTGVRNAQEEGRKKERTKSIGGKGTRKAEKDSQSAQGQKRKGRCECECE